MVHTFIDLFEILYHISLFFYSDFEQHVVMNKQNAGCSHFLGPLGTLWHSAGPQICQL